MRFNVLGRDFDFLEADNLRPFPALEATAKQDRGFLIREVRFRALQGGEEVRDGLLEEGSNSIYIPREDAKVVGLNGPQR